MNAQEHKGIFIMDTKIWLYIYTSDTVESTNNDLIV